MCLICHKVLAYKHDARRHIRLKHGPSGKTVSCEHCGKELKHHWALGDHMRKVHGHYSKKTFGQSEPFYWLIFTHFAGYVESFLEDVGSRIVCIECKKTFTNRQNARRHVRSLHSEAGECFCSICNVSLTNIRTFDDHMRERHNVYKKGKYNMPQSDPLNENWK